jgi:hypothetical protein
VEFQNGTLVAANNESSNINNKANFVVPKGKSGTLKAGYRSTYTGSLTGEGTFNVYTGGVRCYFDGDWSQFTGTVKAYKDNRQNKKSYDPVWAFRNTNGLPNATLSVQKDVRVSNEGKNIILGGVEGEGTLTGSGQWIIDTKDKDLYLNTEIGVTSARTDPYGNTIAKSTSPLTKRGTGRLVITTLGKINGALTVEEGTVTFWDVLVENFLNGASTTTVKGTGRIVGQAMFSTLRVEIGGEIIPCASFFDEETPGEMKTGALGMITVNNGATANFLIGSTENSKLTVGSLTMNGTVKVTFVGGYTPKKDDSFQLWTVERTFSGTPTLDLPTLPDGLYWDATGLTEKNGVLRVTDDISGIGAIKSTAIVDCEVFTANGVKVASLKAQKQNISKLLTAQGTTLCSGTYIVRMRDGYRSEISKIVVR